jgi:hypothetical protein
MAFSSIVYSIQVRLPIPAAIALSVYAIHFIKSICRRLRVISDYEKLKATHAREYYLLGNISLCPPN